MLLHAFLLYFPIVLAVGRICPDGASVCPDSSTCCSLPDGKEGCCPISDAVCCSDHIHCCPSSYKCADGMCVTVENKNITATIIRSQPQDITCPGGNMSCPEDTTCCKNPDGYACCPMENAVCCSDGYHCCPESTTCNLAEGKCEGDRFVSEMYASWKNAASKSKLSYLMVSFHNTICPDHKTQCPSSNTCCLLPGGIYGCCPFPLATCCKDGLHCCPEYMTCDPTYQYCSQGPNNITAKLNTPAQLIVKENSLCPDKKTCGDFETCCKISDTGYGCCQYANATCCNDRQHCCPFGDVCDVAGGRCVNQKLFVLDLSNEV